MRDFWGTLCTSVKQIKAPYLFLLGTRNCSARSAGESGLIFQRAGSLMIFLELQREPGVSSRVTAGDVIKNFFLFTDVRTPI